MDNRQTFLIVGMGGRGLPTFGKGLLGWPEKGMPEFLDRARIVGLMDTNIARCKVCLDELRRRPIPYQIPLFDDLEKALIETKPDWAVICTPDRTHTDVCLLCLKHGANLIVEKPLATSVMECNEIIRAAKKAGKVVRVAHNYRHYRWTQVAQRMIRDGKIGKVLSFEAIEVLGNRHGGDYFHRWHSDYDVSCSMMNHKSCHHFDLINWMIGDAPACASAFGARTLYSARKDIDHADRCSECKRIKQCPYSIDLDKWDGIYRKMYRDSEHVDGYKRDLCVYSNRHTIYDNYYVNLQFAGGVLGTYSLLNFGPREFVSINITGTLGRLETGTSSTAEDEYVTLIRNDGTHQKVEFASEGGMHGHGGADVRMLAALLGMKDEYVRQEDIASAEQARDAIMAADLANRSLAWGGIPVRASQTGSDMPPAPPMPVFSKISPSNGVKLAAKKPARPAKPTAKKKSAAKKVGKKKKVINKSNRK